MSEFATIREIVYAARDRLGPLAWDHFSTRASESRATLIRNRQALDSLALRRRLLVDVSDVDTSTYLLGHHLRIPVILSPIAQLGNLDEGGARTVARVADRFGTTQCVSVNSSPSLEEVIDNIKQPLFLGFTVGTERESVHTFARRVKSSGYSAIMMSCTTALGRPDRPRYRFDPLPELPRPNLTDVDRRDSRRYAMSVTWEDLDDLRDATDLPLILKDVMTAEDATKAVEHGVNVVYVSNHGGQHLDQAPGTIDVLPEIVDAVSGRAEVVIDGGFVRGTDVVKAMALGADAVAIGKLQCWGLAARGEDSLFRTLEILEEEIKAAMAQVGAPSLEQLGASFVRPVAPLMYPLWAAPDNDIPPEVYR